MCSKCADCRWEPPASKRTRAIKENGGGGAIPRPTFLSR